MINGGGESFQIQMIFSFPFLCAMDLRTALLIMRARNFFTPLYVEVTFAQGREGGHRPPPYVLT